MPYTDAGKHVMLDALAGNTNANGPISTMSAHNASPPTDGNEISGGSYARISPTFESSAGTESAGSLNQTNTPEFNIPAGETVASVAYRDSGGTILSYDDVADESYTNAGTYEVTDSDQDLNS